MAVPRVVARSIVKNPQVLHAEPTVEGTRIPVRTIVQLMRLHEDASAVQRELPILTVSDIEAALQYYTAHRDEIEYWIVYDNSDSDETL
jgi:uncharacterized protein (DUF433 family)